MPRSNRRNYRKNPIEIVEPDETYRRLAVGDVTSLRHQDSWPGGSNNLREAVLGHMEEFFARILPNRIRWQTVEDYVDSMVDLLIKSRVTVNFRADEWFADVVEFAPRYQNAWERGGTTGYLETREASEMGVGRYGLWRSEGPSGDARIDAARQRVDRYLMLDSSLFSASSRPRYGALDFAGCTWGAASGQTYGRSFFVVREYIKHRATFTPRDSFFMRSEEGALENQTVTIADMEKLLLYCPDSTLSDIFHYATGSRRLGSQYSHAGHYLEAQLNSTIDMKSDIEAIHLSVSQDLAIFDQETSSSIRAQVQAFTNANGFYYYET